MVRHFFLDKTNSIVEGSHVNMGLNPVLNIGYGNKIIRGLIHFDACEIKDLIEDKTFANLDKLRFTLRMKNYFSIDGLPYEKLLIHPADTTAVRAASFDLILFKLPCPFDEGRGFDFVSDFWVRNRRSVSVEGSNWFYCKSNIPWKYEDNTDKTTDELVMPDIFNKNEFFQIYEKLLNYSKIMDDPELSAETAVSCEEIIEDIKNIKSNYKFDDKSLKGGIYPQATFREEYEKYLDGKESIIVASQHFDFGDEDLRMDITDYVLEVVNTGINYGLGLAFAPRFEEHAEAIEQYVGFVDDNTNTFYHPFVEAVYEDYIDDDRESFTIGKDNRLYLYTFDESEPVNLDKIPTCTINDIQFEVKQASKGVYYAEIPANSLELESAAIYYDIWSGIELNGSKEDDIELEFSTRPKKHKISMGSNSDVKTNFVPSVYGINDNEKITQNEVREVTVDFRREFEGEKKYLIGGAEYRLYVKDGNREVDVINYEPIEKGFLNNYFMIYGTDLIPNKYYVDIKMNTGREIRYFKEALRFSVVSNVTERYQ